MGTRSPNKRSVIILKIWNENNAKWWSVNWIIGINSYFFILKEKNSHFQNKILELKNSRISWKCSDYLWLDEDFQVFLNIWHTDMHYKVKCGKKIIVTQREFSYYTYKHRALVFKYTRARTITRQHGVGCPFRLKKVNYTYGNVII